MLAAIYCRLSKEDWNRPVESESIRNQKLMLMQYAESKGWKIYDIYCDEDYSGADSSRPEFNRMIRDAQQHCFDLILVKTQSRFTRDMELVEKYIHNLFLQWNIRFVAAVENTDTSVKGNKKIRQINGLINEWYLEDLSENIRNVLTSKRRDGQYIGGTALYGYRKDPANRHHLIPDREAAETVDRIFHWYLQGYGAQKIASILNMERVLNPAAYRYRKQHPDSDEPYRGSVYWNRTSVSRILNNRMYAGDLVQARTRKISYKCEKRMTLPVQQQIICPNTHTALIGRELFDKAAEMRKMRTRSSSGGIMHPLAGKVRCRLCGSSMMRYTSGKGNFRHDYLRCRLHSADSGACCCRNIRLDAVERAVSERFNLILDEYFEYPSGTADTGKKECEPNEKRNQMMRKYGLLMRYAQESFESKVISKEEFERICIRIRAKSEELPERNLRGNQESAERELICSGKWHPEEFTHDLATLFLDSVQIGNPDDDGIRDIVFFWSV